MMWLFKKNSSVKPKLVAVYFTGGYKVFEVTDDIYEFLKKKASGHDWDSTVTRLGNDKDGSVIYFNWNKVNYVEFQ